MRANSVPTSNGNVMVAFGDSASLDAFGRVRVSEPSGRFDSQFTYDLQPLVYEQITAETGATIAHDATLSLIATGIGWTSTVRASLKWTEIR